MNTTIKYYRLEKYPNITPREWVNICNTIINYGPKLYGLDYDWRYINGWWIGIPRDKYQLDTNEWYCTQQFPPYIPKHCILSEYEEQLYRQDQLEGILHTYNYTAKYPTAWENIMTRFSKIEHKKDINLHVIWIEWRKWLEEAEFEGITDDFFLRSASIFYFILLSAASQRTMEEPSLMCISDEGLVYDEYGEFIRPRAYKSLL